MQVRQVMTGDVRLATPDQTISETAKIMADTDSGVLPVADNDHLVGVVTDRDIAVRAVARHLSPDTPVREVMSPEVLYCFDDEDIDKVALNMGENQVRRLQCWPTSRGAAAHTHRRRTDKEAAMTRLASVLTLAVCSGPLGAAPTVSGQRSPASP